ncbi:hypothetical protein J7E81_13315 [Bacillus sp. ISL-18]|uniref:hypothetical protein n=1 Tax=Bacillus sp. ISL-18 TaxID=2819118 RepID=UPI001BEA98B4|nr:hypothetical protein [Bacillus sp. ISL-18]MBT2656193.1 hypothetical protein [Bacillus sp. ISL-18]
MELNRREERRRIFRNELYKLREEGYLTNEIVDTVAKAHHQYQIDLLHEEDELNLKTKPDSLQSSLLPASSPKPAKLKKTRSPEEVRERNITWSLNIGVIFLLIGGLFVATSNWESMTNFMKSGSIAIVSLLFYIMAFISKKVLHIDKTAFAFTVLGSLFLPIFILSLGWFGLLGSYLSIAGGGRYLLGMLGSILSLFVYILFAKNLDSRLFVWFTFVSLSLGAAFLLAALHLTVDLFYLGMILFNAILVVVFHRVKAISFLQLFSKEFIPFIQVNLILSTLFMLFLFDNEVMYSFNLLLTAVIYLSMIYVTGKKEYHFIFTVMLVYGVYQLVENSVLEYAGGIVYALVAFGIVFVPRTLEKRFSLDKAFQYTSAIISGLAFIYVSLEGFLLRSEQPSFVLMIAYFIMAVNFIYLTNNRSRSLFPYLSSLFLSTGIYEGISLMMISFEEINLALRVFLTGFILLSVFGILQLIKYVQMIRHAAVEVGLSIMAISMMMAVLLLYWWELGVMLILLAMAAFLLHQYQERNLLKEAASWVLPSALGLSFAAFGEEFNVNSLTYHSEYGVTISFAAGAIMVLFSSAVWAKLSKQVFARNSLYVSQSLYTIAIFQAFISPINYTWVQPLVMAAGIGMYSYFYNRIGAKWIAYFISITTILCYFSVIHAITENYAVYHLVKALAPTVGAILLLVIAVLYRRSNSDFEAAFAWVGHLILPLALVFTWFVYHTDVIFCFILSLAGYTVSTKLAFKEWKIKIFLYGSFTLLFFVISTGMESLHLSIDEKFAFPITSGLMLAMVQFADQEYKRRTTFYFVPFSVMGIGSMLIVYPYGIMPYLITWLYVLVLLIYLYKVKWDIIALVPLGFTFLATIEYMYAGDLPASEKMLVFAIIGTIFTIIGQFLYKKVYEPGTKILEVKIDGYTVIAFLFFAYMYFLENQHLWSHALPGMLFALSFWLQRKRVPAGLADFITIAAGAYLLQPYYAIISAIYIPSLWLREVQVLPFILMVIFIRCCLKEKYVEVVKAIQWLVLVIVSLILIQDAMASSTIYDAIILGSLSLLSLVAGMFIQIKSYFFVGAGVLLLNVFLQTRPYWGNMPWWAYLLVSGLILITIASFNEWHKQKVQKGESTFITFLKVTIIERMRKWN